MDLFGVPMEIVAGVASGVAGFFMKAQANALQAVKDMADNAFTGITVAGGSDCPVEQPSPLWGMAAARDRKGITPAEEVSPEAALAMFTDGVAAALGEDQPLTPGTPAHLTVLTDDPATSPPGELPTMDVESVWVRGREAWRAEG